MLEYFAIMRFILAGALMLPIVGGLNGEFWNDLLGSVQVHQLRKYWLVTKRRKPTLLPGLELLLQMTRIREVLKGDVDHGKIFQQLPINWTLADVSEAAWPLKCGDNEDVGKATNEKSATADAETTCPPPKDIPL